MEIEIAESAHRHGLGDDDIVHAWENAMTVVTLEHSGEERLLVIGPARSGALLELVAVPPTRPCLVIHADRLRSKFFGFLP
ncbi:BrnT family toxin [Demequina silvatica]|uniref:BrnT family toxin n=1 Tax=Demequina silvatica TaxID=1638988 RepID=UPI000AC39C5A|nr:BrnT family toxin [Demequina silvatica]